MRRLVNVRFARILHQLLNAGLVCNSFRTVAALSPTLAIAASISSLGLPKCLHQKRVNSFVDRSIRLRGGFADEVFITDLPFTLSIKRLARATRQSLRSLLPIWLHAVVFVDATFVVAVPIPTTAFAELRRLIELIFGEIDAIPAEVCIVSQR
jgi:hypothetical protein